MKEEEPNWFSRWEEELPSPEELTPLSQTLITPDLALAFDIPSPNSTPDYHHHHHHNHAQQQIPNPPPSQSQSQTQQPQLEYDSSELGGGGGMGGGPGDDQARTLKRPRLVWTPQLHKRFVDAVAHLGIKNAVPKTIMQLMNVDGLTRENVASHLQKYRLYLKRMQGLSGGGGGPGGSVGSADTAMDHLFASAPVPHHFLNRGPPPPIGSGGGGGGAGGGPEQFTSFVPVAALQHHQQMAAAAAHQQQQYYQHRHMGHIGSPPGGGFDHGLLTRQPQTGIHRIVGPPGLVMAPPAASVGSYAEEMNSATVAGGGGRKELTLFPTNDD